MKKITLFLDKTFRNGIAPWSVAYQAALAFYAELIRYISDPSANLAAEIIRHMNQGDHPSHLKNIERSIWQLREAHRIEACVTLRYGQLLTLEVRAYDSGKREPFYTAQFEFTTGGSAAGCGASHANRERCV